MRTLAAARPRYARIFEAPDAGNSTAPAEIDGQEVFVHKRVNLFPRGKGQPQ
ncbi:hypothetical protein AB2M62_04695 [Sphingomonas sp. MMS12-HWE2-04]|uniref:hypothetical protein n=1 Tax=Sphingomonas sp. MMS12-HWE2-04 TaxID=3234199 RepID=UPI00385134FF